MINGQPPEEVTMINYLLGQRFDADIYIEKLDFSSLPDDQASLEENEKFVYELFLQKVGCFFKLNFEMPFCFPTGQTCRLSSWTWKFSLH